MGKNVFANSMEIAGKATSNKVVASMPNVCVSPPSPPAGPIPIPYPVFGKASDTDKGSKQVFIGGKPVCLKNSSNFKKTKGDMAATKSFGQGATTGGLGGPAYHSAWSFDVKFEGKNVCRFGDLVGGNSASFVNSLNTTANLGKLAFVPPTEADCKKLEENNEEKDKEISEKLEKRGKDRKDAAKMKTKQCESSTTSSANCLAGGSDVFNGASANSAGKGLLQILSGDIDLVTTPIKTPSSQRPESEYMCKGEGNNKKHKYEPKSGSSSCDHTEGHLIERAFEQAADQNGRMPIGSVMTIAINWKKTGTDENGEKKTTISNDPCDACKKTICHARECGLEIVLCKKGKPEQVTDKDCKKSSKF